jgi:urease gamma subunit
MPELIRLAEANGYAVAGTHAIKVDLLEKIRDEVNVMEPELLSDVKEVLDRYSVSEDVLEKIGYKVVWTGLFDDNARLEKLK